MENSVANYIEQLLLDIHDLLALKNGDQLTFEEAISTLFKLTDTCIAEKEVDYTSDFRFSLNARVKETFELILGQVIATKDIPLISFLVYKSGDLVKTKALQQMQVTSPYNDVIDILVNYAKTAMDNNRDCVVYISSLCRQLAQKGIYDPETGKRVKFFKNQLTVYPHYIKIIG